MSELRSPSATLHVRASRALTHAEHMLSKLEATERVDHVEYTEGLAGVVAELAGVVKDLAWKVAP